MMAFLLNNFCYRLAVYLGNYVILFFILSIRPIPFSFMGGQAGNLPHTQWGEIAMRDTFQALHRLRAPSLAFFDYFFTVTRSHSVCIPPSLTCTRAAKRRLTAADDFHDAPFSQLFMTHTLALRHTNKGTFTMRKIFSPPYSVNGLPILLGD